MLAPEIIKEVFKLNGTFNEKAEELYGFRYETNGWYECIIFNEHVLWDSEDLQAMLSERPDFDSDTMENDIDPDVIGCIKRRFNDYVNTLKKCRYNVKSKTENEDVWEAVNEIISDLKDRKGLGEEWDEIDDDTQDEIFQKWINIIEKHN